MYDFRRITYSATVRNLSRNLLLSFVVFVVPAVYGAVPPVNVTVSDGRGKVAFKGTTNATGMFATASLKPGNYVVRFNSTSAAVKGDHYRLVISAGETKVSANAVAGEKFVGAGVAMNITVGAPMGDTLKKHPELNNPVAIRAMERMERESGSSITGQIMAESKVAH